MLNCSHYRKGTPNGDPALFGGIGEGFLDEASSELPSFWRRRKMFQKSGEPTEGSAPGGSLLGAGNAKER